MCFWFVFFDVDRCINIIFYKVFIYNDGIFIVVVILCYEVDYYVMVKCKFIKFYRRIVSKDFFFYYFIVDIYDWMLVVVCILVRVDKF